MSHNENEIRQDAIGRYHVGGNELNENHIIETALQILEKRVYRETQIGCPADTIRYLQTRIGRLEHEVFVAIWLDNRHRVIACDELFRGTIDGASVYPREVAKAALKHNAAAVIFAHNHPSGVTEPSSADRAITRRLTDALALFDIRTLDSVIVAPGSSFSMAEAGMI